MKITLAQAINLLSSLHKKVNELQNEFFTVHIIEVPKGENYTPYDRTVEDVLQDLSDVQQDILSLKEIIQEANLKNQVEWDGRSISMITAIESAKQLRYRLDFLKHLPLLKSGNIWFTITQVRSWNKLLYLTHRNSKNSMINYPVKLNYCPVESIK